MEMVIAFIVGLWLGVIIGGGVMACLALSSEISRGEELARGG
jgi:hypothetical protein